MIGLSLVTGWLPSQIEKEDYGAMTALVARINKRTNANKEAAQELDFERKLKAERKARGM